MRCNAARNFNRCSFNENKEDEKMNKDAKERKRECNRRWYRKNKTRLLKRFKLWRIKNKERANELSRIWSKRNKKRKREISLRSAEIKRLGRLASEIKKELGEFCANCGTVFQLCVHHIDLSGQSKKPNNSIVNLMVLCRACHCRLHRTKGGRT